MSHTQLKLAQNDQIVLLDVRTKQEWQEEHIKSAYHLPLNSLLGLEKLPFDKEKQIYVFCKSGNRAEKAVGFLKEKGFNAFNAGGLNDIKSD